MQLVEKAFFLVHQYETDQIDPLIITCLDLKSGDRLGPGKSHRLDILPSQFEEISFKSQLIPLTFEAKTGKVWDNEFIVDLSTSHKTLLATRRRASLEAMLKLMLCAEKSTHPFVQALQKPDLDDWRRVNQLNWTLHQHVNSISFEEAVDELVQGINSLPVEK